MLPFLVFLTTSVYCFFIIYKGTPALGLNKISLSTSSLYSLSISSGVSILFYLIGVPFVKKRLNRFNIRNELNNIPSPGSLSINYNYALSKEKNIKILKETLTKLEKNLKQEKIR